MSNTVIKVEDLGKLYRLGEIGTGTISHDLNRWWARLRGKEDPFAKVGEANDRTARGTSEYVWALKDVSFEVKQGEVLGIIGRNGAGKSTLLKILSKVTTPSQGRIKVKGRIASLLEVGTGFHPELTGRENIFLNGAILGMSKAEIRAKFDEIVDFAGVERYIDTPVKRYSSGMYVRLAFAVAAFLEPEILIVDEVLAVGDAEFQKKCLGRMQDVSRNDGRTVLFVSHNMGSLLQLCTSGVLLKNGQLKKVGKIKEVVDSYISKEQVIENEYRPDENIVKTKKNYFTSIYCTNRKGERVTDITFDEEVVLNFRFIINEHLPNLQIGIGLNDKYQYRVSTFLKPLGFFKKDSHGVYKGSITIPSKIIAPNLYSFVFALWTKEGYIFDIVENVCSIKIHDSGTDLALYEGGDHGSVILKPNWSND